MKRILVAVVAVGAAGGLVFAALVARSTRHLAATTVKVALAPGGDNSKLRPARSSQPEPGKMLQG